MKALMHHPTNNIRPAARPAGRSTRPGGFTLIELLTVITLIVLLLAIALPSVIAAFTAGADAQAFNMLSAMCNSARAVALTENNYAAVHVQISDRPEHDEVAWVAVLRYDSDGSAGHTAGTFYYDSADPLEELPGHMAFGELKSPYLSGSSYPPMSDSALAGFTTFTIVFDNEGQVVKYPDQQDIHIDSSTLFDQDGGSMASSQLWVRPAEYSPSSSTDNPGATAVTVFDLRQMLPRDEDDRASYLNEYGQFLPLNIYTGKFFTRYGQ